MNWWILIAIIPLLSITYVIYENDFLIVLIAISSVPLFRRSPAWGAALFGVVFLAACLSYYSGDVESAFRMGVASIGVLSGDVAAALMNFGREGKEKRGRGTGRKGENSG